MELMSNDFVALSDIALKSKDSDDVQDVKRLLHSFTKQARAASAITTSGGEDETVIESPGVSEPPRDLTLSPRIPHDLAMISDFNALHRKTRTPSKGKSWTGGTDSHSYPFTPRLTHGLLWSWSTPRNSRAVPKDIESFIFAGQDSFAARLYFKTMVVTHDAMRSLNGLDPSYVYRSLRYTMTSELPDLILKQVAQRLARLTFNHGAWEWDDSDDDDSDADDQDCVSLVIVAAARRALVEDGMCEEDFLDLWGVEAYLRTHWRLHLDAAIHLPVTKRLLVAKRPASNHHGMYGAGNAVVPHTWNEPRMVGGISWAEKSIDDLLAGLSLEATCLGNGPHWTFRDIDRVVCSWLT